MKRAFLILIALIVLALGILFGVSLIPKGGNVEKNPQAAEVETDEWNRVLSDFINNKGVIVSVNGNEKKAVMGRDVIMNDGTEVRLSVDFIKENFDCAVDVFDRSRVVIAKGEKSLSAEIGAEKIYVTEYDSETNYALGDRPQAKEQEVDAPVSVSENRIFVPAEILVKGLDYEYEWDSTYVCANFTYDSSKPAYPCYYSRRDMGAVSPVKNQGKLSACWAFAALDALENTLLPEDEWDFSEDNMVYNNAFSTGADVGGDHLMSLAYLASWAGPVLEEDDPYDDGYSDDDCEEVMHVQGALIIDNANTEKIKELVFRYGAVQSTIYLNLTSDEYINGEYYDTNRYSYCFPENIEANHEVVIVGWNDNFPASYFKEGASRDGAFICRNSWGEYFGDDGYFYVSYDDCSIGEKCVAFTRVDNVTNYDNIYQYDEAGWIGNIGYGRNKAYMANVFTAEKDEWLGAASFYATAPNTSYKIYACSDFTGTKSFDVKGSPLAEGTLSECGYYTVDFNRSVLIEEGKQFAVIVEISTPGSSKPVAVELRSDDKTADIDVYGDDSYISSYGDVWENTQESSGCTVCLKAFTVDK